MRKCWRENPDLLGSSDISGNKPRLDISVCENSREYLKWVGSVDWTRFLNSKMYTRVDLAVQSLIKVKDFVCAHPISARDCKMTADVAGVAGRVQAQRLQVLKKSKGVFFGSLTIAQLYDCRGVREKNFFS